MARESVGDADTTVARLHPNRGPGILYGSLTVIVLVVVLLGAIATVNSGRIAIAVVLAVGGLALSGFLAYLTVTLMIPALEASATGIRGRIAWRKTVDARWREIVIDVNAGDAPGRFRLNIGGETMPIDAQSWRGFHDFVVLVANSPEAARSLTRPARREVRRLLQLTG